MNWRIPSTPHQWFRRWNTGRETTSRINPVCVGLVWGTTGRSTRMPGYEMAVSIKLLSINWHIDSNKQVSRLHDIPNANLRGTRQKHYTKHHSNAGTDGDYSDRENCAIGIDGIRYRWLYTQISNMTRGLAGISRSGWIITSKVLITHKISHINFYRRHILYVERYYALGFV